ncbi:MAG: transglutaminase family protein [Pirellulaceae bacterium]|nr:transglutaminase family protein [Pirellulaceae bacterium]
MIRMQLDLELNYEVAAPGCDFIFNLHAAHTACQRVYDEKLSLSQSVTPEVFSDGNSGNRYARLRAQAGLLHVRYQATVEVQHHMAAPETIGEVPVSRMPVSVLNYIYPSRYCESDRLSKLAIRQFGKMWQGYTRVQAIQKWVQEHVSFASNTTNSNTSAVDTIISQVGVCRDFAHLMIALCRALSIPARFVTGTDYGADPALGPPDFHAYVEVFLGDRWYLFDPSGTAIPMGLVRVGTGRDAADVSFATIFGTVKSTAPKIFAQATTDGRSDLVLPYHCREALSTD